MPDTIVLEAATRYKLAQRNRWDDEAPTLRRWFPAFERFMAPVTPTMIALAGVRPGGRVVDVASGFGEPALTVARAVGPDGRVVVSDLSTAMLAVAEQRAHAAGLHNVDMLQMDAKEPTLLRRSFDTVLCRLGLIFLPDLATALERSGALLVEGGRFVAAVWGPGSSNPWLTLASHTLTEFLELPPPPRGAPGIFDLGRPGALEDAMARSGLGDIRTRNTRLRFSWPSAVDYAEFHRSSPLNHLLSGEDPLVQTEAWRAVEASAQRRWRGGSLKLGGHVVVVSGRRLGAQQAFP